MHFRLPLAIALTWALTTLSTHSPKNPQEAANAVLQPEDLHDALEARGRIPLNPLPNENGVNPSGSNPSGAHPEGTAPCGTYLPEATDGPCGYWWLAAHPGYHRTTMTKTTVAMATVTATLTPPVVVETETKTVG